MVEIFVASLITILISFFISRDEGPFRLFFIFRDILGAYDLDERGMAKTVLGRGIKCPVCVSFWVSLAVFWFIAGADSIFIGWLATAGLVRVYLLLGGIK